MPVILRRTKVKRCSEWSVERASSTPPKLEKKIVFISIVNMISFVVTLKQLWMDVLWNMNVRIRDPDLMFSCSSFDPENQCCAQEVQSSINQLFKTNQISEKHVLSFIVIGGVSAFALIFMIAGFCVGFRSKYRNSLMHPVFTVGILAHVTNCIFFAIGTNQRHASESGICGVSTGSSAFKISTEKRIAVNCLKQVLSCRDLDSNFKYWFLFSLGWVLVALFSLGILYKYSGVYFKAALSLLSCSQRIGSKRQIFPQPETRTHVEQTASY